MSIKQKIKKWIKHEAGNKDELFTPSWYHHNIVKKILKDILNKERWNIR